MGRPARISVSLLALSLTALTGCSNMESTAPVNLAPISNAASISGHVHGGQQPVGQATVKLYISGTSSYGAGSTLRATTKTDDYGNFSFTKAATASDTVTPTTASWACPTTGDPQVYIIANGGNTQGPPAVVDDGTNTTTTTYNNPAVALLAAIGDCASVTNNMYVSLNELTTVASTFALAQYINPGSSAGAESIGTSGSAQGTIGLNNAVASIANLVSISAGTPVASTPYTGSGSTSGITVTATPETAKLITLANTLAACINSTNGSTTVTVTPDATGIPGTPVVTTTSGNQCLDLLNSAVPPTNTYTSQPTATFTTAADTIQAAYYMATNPADLGTFYSSCHDGGTTNIACLFGLATSQSPFQTGLASQPSDWTIGVDYTASGTCSGTGNGGAFIAGSYKSSVDASGNIWFLSGAASGANLSEMSPTGTPMVCLGNSAGGRGLTIDPTGNVWASFNAGIGLNKLAPGGTSLTKWSTGSDSPYTVVSDGLGNVYYSIIKDGGALYQFATPNSTATPFAATFYVGPITTPTSGTTIFYYIATDSANRLWIQGSGQSNLFYTYPTATSATASITAYSQAISSSGVSVVTFTASNTFANGQDVLINGFTTSNGMSALNGAHVVVAGHTATSFTGKIVAANSTVIAETATGTATLEAATIGSGTETAATAYGLAIDSGNNIYNATTCCSAINVGKFNVASNGATMTKVYSSTAYIGGLNGGRSSAIDGAGNIWIGNEFSSVSNGTAANSTNTGNFSLSEISSTGTLNTNLSPNGATPVAPATCSSSGTAGCPNGGGFIKSTFEAAWDLSIDPSGNVWVMNTGLGGSFGDFSGTSITEVIGAAVPVVTPLSVAAGSSKLGSKP